MPSDHQGMLLRSQGGPVLYLSNPTGVTGTDRRTQLDALAAINEGKQGTLVTPRCWLVSANTRWLIEWSLPFQN